MFRPPTHLGASCAAGLVVLGLGRPGSSVAKAAPSQPPGAAEPAGDIVETIGEAPTATPPPAAPPPASPDRFEVHGWTRQSIEIGTAKNAYYDTQPDPEAVPYDALIARTQLFIATRYSRERWFEADVSGLLSYSFFEQTPDRRATTFDGFNGQSTRGSIDTQLYEALVAFYWNSFDLRVGKQRVAWGRADFISPNDVVNARDTRDPFVSEIQARTIPTLLARADVDLRFGSLQLLYQPVFIPDRFDVYGSNWAGVQPDAPGWIRGVANVVARNVDPTQKDTAQSLVAATKLPAADLTSPVLGARFSWSIHGLDVNHYYQYGFDGPLVSIDPALAAMFSALNFSNVGLASFQPLLQAIDAGAHPLQETYVRRHHVGLDASTTLGPVALRLDAAYESSRVFFRNDLTGMTTPTTQGVLSLEYQTGNADNLFLVEAMFLHLLDDPMTQLIGYDRNTVGTGLDLRFKVWGPVHFELRSMIGVRPLTQVIQPQVNLKFEPLVISLGGLWMSGEDWSFGHYFERNREAYVKAKWLF